MVEKLKRGFSLVEMMVVVSIIGTLAALLLPSATQMISKAKQAGTQGIVNAAFTGLIAYSDDNGDYPQNWGWSISWWLRDYLREYMTFNTWGSFLQDGWKQWMNYYYPSCWGIVGTIYSNGANMTNETWSCDWWRYWGYAGDDIGRTIRK